MNYEKRPYIGIPYFLFIKDQNLNYQDILVHTSIKSFDNDESNCFASHETIGKLAGLSKRFVIEAIKRLEHAGYLAVYRPGKYKESNQYYFPRSNNVKIPREIFKCNDLTSNEKAILICLRQLFNHGENQSTDSISVLAKHLGLTYNVLVKQMNSLIAKNYISKKTILSGNSAANRFILTSKLDWKYRYGEVIKPTIIQIKVA